jgi:hypothetical protein
MYQIQQVSDVFVDACVRNEAGQLMFLSAFGRDTAVKELMARMELSLSDNHSLSELTLKGTCDHAGESHAVMVGDPKRLDKHTGRLPKRKLFGNMTHVWIYDPAIREPDKGSRSAWLVDRFNAGSSSNSEVSNSDIRERIWATIVHLASIPLLPHWRDTVLQAVWRDMVFEMGKTTSEEYNPRFSKPLGGMQAFRIALTEDFPNVVSQLIKDGKLFLEIGAAQTVLLPINKQEVSYA